MSAPLIVLVLVAVGDAHDASFVAMTTTAEGALGPGTIVVVRDVEATPNDVDALSISDVLHADALVEVSWPDADRHRARLHVHASKTSTKWDDREIAFAPNDAESERGRTLGFAVASMIPAPNPAPPTSPTLETSPTPAPTTSATSTPIEAPASSESSARVGLELVGLGSAGIGGSATGVGGEVGARLHVTDDVAIRIGGGVRFGSIGAATANSSTTRLAGGVAWDFVHAASRRLSFTLRLDALVLRDALARTDRDEHGARWMPGADAFIEGAWSFSTGGAIVVGVGPEVAFGTTRVVVGATTVATLPPVRALASIGVRARF